MSLNTAYNLLPLPVGDWVFWLPFPLMCLLLLACACLILAVVGLRLWRKHENPVLASLVFACIPLWGAFLFVFKVKAWLVWTLAWFYGLGLLALIVFMVRRKMMPIALALLAAALIQHQGSVLMVWALSRT